MGLFFIRSIRMDPGFRYGDSVEKPAIMPCPVCLRFPVPRSKFEALEINEELHATLYRCKACGTHFEMAIEERAPRFWPIEELRKHYKAAAAVGS